MLTTRPGVLCCLILERSPRPKEGPEEAQHMRGRPVRYAIVIGRNGSPANHTYSVFAEQHRCGDVVYRTMQRLPAMHWAD